MQRYRGKEGGGRAWRDPSALCREERERKKPTEMLESPSSRSLLEKAGKDRRRWRREQLSGCEYAALAAEHPSCA